MCLPEPTFLLFLLWFVEPATFGVYIAPIFLLLDHCVDGAPVGNATKVHVVNEHVGIDLAVASVWLDGLLGEVLVHGIELHTTLTAPLYGLLELLATAYGPQNELVLVLNELA